MFTHRQRLRIAAELLFTYLSGIVSGFVLLNLWMIWIRRRRHARVGTKPRWQRPIVCISGSGSNEKTGLTQALGEWCASMGYHILTGGGGGVVSSVSRAFAHQREKQGHGGLVLAVLPGVPAARAANWTTVREEVTSKLLVDQSSGSLQYSVVLDSFANDEPDEAIIAPMGYPNEYTDVALRTHLPSSGSAGLSALSRNHITVLSANVVVALPGGPGTASEVELAIRHGVPVCRYFAKNSDQIEGLSHYAQEKAPAFTDFPSLQVFINNAVMSAHHTARKATQLPRRASMGFEDRLTLAASNSSCSSWPDEPCS
eukprot:TRINITY_DN50684_c0_g1_i1.p1 TRINITY_DN50684_c0_g1~~TRINITY_DN50684_c0_g1_i1.p1  ORF type:complete len:330 (+),score=26.57 TRINITY_DN50684_c0_g1_i1:50-991(+)